MTQYQEILETAKQLAVEINEEGSIKNWWLFNEDPSTIIIERPDLSEFFWNSEYKGWTYYKVENNIAIFDNSFKPLSTDMRITILDYNNKAISQEWKPYYKDELITPLINDFGINIWDNDHWIKDSLEQSIREEYILRTRRNIFFAAFDVLKINLRIDYQGGIHPDLSWNPELVDINQERWDTEFKQWYLDSKNLISFAIGNPPKEILYYANLV